MGACQLIGEVPTSIYNISTMQVMIFGANRLVGTLPSDLSRFPMLNVRREGDEISLKFHSNII